MTTALASALLLAASAATGEGPSRIPPPGELPSVLSGATLGDGGSALLVTAGYPFLSGAYAQGLSPGLDAGAQLELDWVTSELFAGGTLRRAALRSGDFDVALRGRAGLYGDMGATWAYDRNRSDVGLQISPGAVVSAALTRGVVSLSADLPFTLTTARGGGVIFAPRAGLAFETPLFGEWSAGARVGALWHVASGGAPFAHEPRGAVELSAVLTYRLF
jgi:hypothetical protein